MNHPYPIEQILVDDAHGALPADDFTRRVMARLPAPAARGFGWKPALVLGSAALGGVLAMTLAPAGPALLQGFIDIAGGQAVTSSAIAAAVTAIAMTATALILAAEVD